MSAVFRVFVEKKINNDIEAMQTLNDLKNNLGILSLDKLRIVNRYDVEGISREEFNDAVITILSEPNLDNVYFDIDLTGWKYFVIEYLPGQYDQRADSAAQCIQFLTGGERPIVASAKIIAVNNSINDFDFEKIKNYMINPVESREASMVLPSTLKIESEIPDDIPIVEGFTQMTNEDIEMYHDKMGLAMSFDDLAWVRDYFKTEGRDPSLTEIKVIDTYWSDHCRHTTFATVIDNIDVEDSKYKKAIEDAIEKYYEIRNVLYRDKKHDACLMDLACIGTKVLKRTGQVDDLDESEEINACSINVKVDIDGKYEDWLVQFKNETHNHPTEIEPFGGAATCLGGAIRDPLSGRAYVYQAMRITGAADPNTPYERTLEGKLPQSKITVTAAEGYSSYGNQIGLATGQVEELYDSGYVAKRMEIGAVIGASPKENVIRLTPQDGDVIILLGGATGRDGCGGATGSSKAHNISSLKECGAEVQKGNPPTERKLQRLFSNPEASKLIKRCNDFGAGGVAVAIGELSDGVNINLDLVPKKYEGLDGTELAISESQERMAVVVNRTDSEKFQHLANQENLVATPVATVTDNPRLVMTWRGKTIVDISREFLNTNGVTQHTNIIINSVDENNNYRTSVPKELQNMRVSQAFIKNLSRLEVCCQKGLGERFDSTIGASTVNMPYAGKYQLTPEEAMVAKIPVQNGETDTATAMSYGFIPGISRWSPFHSAAFAVTQSLEKLAVVGCDPRKARLTFQEYFEHLGDDPHRWGKPAAALLGALTAQLGYSTPAIGGKDSMSGSFDQLDVPPTLVSFAVGITSASKTGSAQFKHPFSAVKMLELPIDKETGLPLYSKAMDMMTKVYEGVRDGKISAAATVKEGGAAATIAKMSFGNKFGFSFIQNLSSEILFAPLQGNIIIELSDKNYFEEGLLLGYTNENSVFIIDGKVYTTNELISIWQSKLEKVFPMQSSINASMPFNIDRTESRSIYICKNKVAKPRVFIPTFPGTNCEMDSARAFKKAGADVDVFIINNLTPMSIDESINKMEQMISQSQIVMIPGGFSAGDEPDGSGKFIATAFRNPKIREAIMNLLYRRDGLMLGICNGFQALIKLGLVPYGEIRRLKNSDPTLTFNTIGRHISSMAYTKVISTKSPWLSFVNPGDIFAVPISHGEGRFVANNDILRKLITNKQIATQYVTPEGKAIDSRPFNPNGSVCAIEGITSPDGRIFGKMAHCERVGKDICKNVPFEKDMKIFESGVQYFK